jgi:hypothetical protein
MNYLSTRNAPPYFATTQQTQVKMHNLCITNLHFVISFQKLWHKFKYLFRFANGVAIHHLSSAITWTYQHMLTCQKFKLQHFSHTAPFAHCKNPPKKFISKNAKILHIHRSPLKKLNGITNISIQLYR